MSRHLTCGGVASGRGSSSPRCSRARGEPRRRAGGRRDRLAERRRVVDDELSIGTFDLSEPSAYAPPGPHQLAGYTEAYVDDFTGPRNLSGRWGRFSGTPKGDPAGRFVPDHVWSRDGELRIGTWRDPADHDRWATGGVCLCGVHPTYGAFFVRSRQTTAGPDVAELLWPANNAWPPELDFNETGTSPDASTWTDHYTSPSTEVQATTQIDVEHWHTWGVVWTPTSVTFVVDGRAWGEVTSPAQIPDVAMTLDLQQRPGGPDGVPDTRLDAPRRLGRDLHADELSTPTAPPRAVAMGVAGSAAYARGMDDLAPSLATLVDDAVDEMVDMRRDLHRHPSSASRRLRTTGVVTDRLDALGLTARHCRRRRARSTSSSAGAPAPRCCCARTSTPSPSRVRARRRRLGRRGPHARVRSRRPHRRDARGRLGARLRARTSSPGRYVFLFQPAEESLGGARAMVEGGVLEGLDATAMIGCHVTSKAPVGLVALRDGVLMSEVRSFRV